MKNLKINQKPKFSLFNYMTVILINFCEENGLEHCSASEIDYKTEEQRQWLNRFVEVYYAVEERYCERKWGTK